MIQNAADDFANLPSELATKHAALLDAMTQDDDPQEWVDGTTFERACAPQEVATILIPIFHRHLRPKRFAFLWREDIARRGSTVLGKAALASGQVRFFGEVDYVLVFNWTSWSNLTPRQRLALVDHELLHCAVDPETDKPKLRGHDLEEFTDIVKRYGLWRPDVKEFADAVIECTQTDLFSGDDMAAVNRSRKSKSARDAAERFLDSIPDGGSVTITAEGHESVTLTGKDA